MSGRFFTAGDPAIDTLAGRPVEHWSRRYEYAWALSQVRPGEVVLDAGCGIEPQHTYKYALAAHSQRVYAADADPQVLTLPRRDRLQYVHADLRNTGLPPESVDTIYCLSVLEHIDPHQVPYIWEEFCYLLKPGGRVVLSFDVNGPAAYPRHFWTDTAEQVLAQIPDTFRVPDVDPVPAPDAITHQQWNLHVFRVVLEKAGTRRPSILIASPVRQEPDVFRVFLQGLMALDTNGLDVDLWLSFHECWDALRPVMERFRPEQKFGQVHVFQVTGNAAYRRAEDTHHWTGDSIALVAGLKNQALAHFRRGHWDALLYLDSDTLLHRHSLQAMWRARRDMILPVSWTKWTPDQPAMPNVWDFHPYGFYPDTQALLATPGLYRVGGGGGGSLIRRQVLMHPGVNWSPVPGLPPGPGMWAGEDRQFCTRIHAHGHEVWADTRRPVLHIYRSEDLRRADEFLKGGPDRGLRTG